MATKRQRLKMQKKAEANTIDFLTNQDDSKLRYALPTASMYKEMAPKEKAYMDNLVNKIQNGSKVERDRAIYNYMHDINAVNKKKLSLSFEFTQKVYNLKKLVDDRMELFRPAKQRRDENKNFQKQIDSLKKEIGQLEAQAKFEGDRDKYKQEINDLKTKQREIGYKWTNNSFAEVFMEAFETLPENETKHTTIKNTGGDFAFETLDTSHEYMRQQTRNLEAYVKDDGYVIVADLDGKASSDEYRGRYVWGGYMDLQEAIDVLNMYMRKSGPSEQWGTSKAEDIF